MKLSDEQIEVVDTALDMLMCAMRAANWEGDASYQAGERARALLSAIKQAAPVACDRAICAQLDKCADDDAAEWRTCTARTLDNFELRDLFAPGE